MSKKMLKRSLALGALMAFVITGSAMAGEWNVGADHQKEGYYEVEKSQVIPSDGEQHSYANNLFEDLQSNGNGGAVNLQSGSDAKITWSTFSGNKVVSTAKHPQGGAIYNGGGKLIVDHCLFEGNYCNGGGSPYGSVISTNYGGETTISNSEFKNNGNSSGGHLFAVQQSSELILENNKFHENTEMCIKLYAESDKLTFKGINEFYENDSNSILNNGNVVFETGSETYFKDAGTNFVGSGAYEIKEDATVQSLGGISVNGSLKLDGTLELGADSTITNLGGTGGVIHYLKDIDLTVTNNTATNLSFTASGEANDAVNGDVRKLIGNSIAANGNEKIYVTMEKGSVVGIVNATLDSDENGILKLKTLIEAPHPDNTNIHNMSNIAMMSWRAETNDMNKRMGELRNANGELGVWVRAVGGEAEYKSIDYDYNQYQLGYDEKLSTDPSWTVGVALSYTDAESSFDKGSGENEHKGLAIYGSKLNADGSFVDLIAKYSRLEHDFTVDGDKGDYSTNGYSVSAEYGKRYEQGNGLWIEPQVELTYGKVKSAEYQLGKKTVNQDAMESLIGRVGFSLGKDIKQGNVYARASYLYDFEGETATTFANVASRTLEDDLGGGWWEVGVGANINLSKATYIYADVEKTFGGEVDTNWQWNLGVRYSF